MTTASSHSRLLAYRRSVDGKVVHRAACRTLSPGQGSAWPYADGKTADDIVQTLAAAPWLRACKVCRPDAEAHRG